MNRHIVILDLENPPIKSLPQYPTTDLARIVGVWFYVITMFCYRLVHQGRQCGGIMVAHLPLDDDGNKIVRIGHSPDPDDAFMFHAMTTGAFPTPGYNFVHELQDIETLNHRAMNCELEVSAVSIHCLLYTSPSPRDGLLSRIPSSA